MKFIILHISDIHIKASSDQVLSRAENIATCVFEYLPGVDTVFIAISGDLAFSGRKEQYDLIAPFLNKIKVKIQKEKECAVEFVTVPGNHDCNFENSDGARNIIIDSITEKHNIDKSIVSICTKVQADYFKFRDEIECYQAENEDYLWRSRRFSVGDVIVGFECLNVSWLSKLHEEYGQLYFPIENYKDAERETCDISIFMLHHPLNWYKQSAYREFRTFIRTRSDLIITGHEHQAAAGKIEDTESGISSYVEGTALQGESNASGFNIININTETRKFSFTEYKWKKTRYEMDTHGAWIEFQAVQQKRANPLQINQAFRDKLNDPGALVVAPNGKGVSLSDIFVYPDLRIANEVGSSNVYVNSKVLLDPDKVRQGILLQGEDKSGATSLLFQLYQHYHDIKITPIYLRGCEIKHTSTESIKDTIKSAFKKQYNNSQLKQFMQLSKHSKILLVDDFDLTEIASVKERRKLLNTLREMFEYIVFVVNEMFELKELLEDDINEEATPLGHYIIQQINYKLRYKIIEKWYTATSDPMGDGDFIAQCDKADRQIESIMGKTLIPSAPLYLVTLLQSISLNNGNEFKDSALGYYYQYLITTAFGACGVRADMLTELFQYTSLLAWEFHRLKKTELSYFELESFNKSFSEQWTKVEFGSRLQLLLDARILTSTGGLYSFRYPYIYYYLKAFYIARNLDDTDVNGYISHCTKHLYVREHANTIIFLAHHSHDIAILDSIAKEYAKLYSGCAPVRLEDDTNGINSMIEVIQQFVYSGEDPKSYRKRQAEIKDEFCDGSDGLATAEEESEHLSPVARLTMLFKTAEILGQILKNQYATIKRGRKVELITQIFNGQLSALRSLYDFLEKNPDVLYNEVRSIFIRKKSSKTPDEIDALVRKLSSKILQAISYMFLHKAANCVNTQNLHDETHEVIELNPTIAFKLTEIIAHLDSPKQLPRHLISELYPIVKDNFLACNLLKVSILHRMYLFKTSTKDMQWASQSVGISIDQQNMITYQHKQRRLIK